MENMSICMKTLPDTVGLSHTAVNVSQVECGTHLSGDESYKLSSLWLCCLCSQGYPAVSPEWSCLPLCGTKGTIPLPKPASQKLPHFSQALKENKDKIQLMDQYFWVPLATNRSWLLSKPLVTISGYLIIEVKPNLGKILKCSWLLG